MSVVSKQAYNGNLRLAPKRKRVKKVKEKGPDEAPATNIPPVSATAPRESLLENLDHYKIEPIGLEDADKLKRQLEDQHKKTPITTIHLNVDGAVWPSSDLIRALDILGSLKPLLPISR